MAERRSTPSISDQPPPLYRANTSDSEVRLPLDSAQSLSGQLHLSTGDMAGLRQHILDNAATLFTLYHGGKATVPTDFRLNTIKTPAGENRADAGKIYAFLLFRHPSHKTSLVLALFVNSPPADSTEGALRALLQKMEGMMGRKWRKAIDSELVTRHEAFFLGD